MDLCTAITSQAEHATAAELETLARKLETIAAELRAKRDTMPAHAACHCYDCGRTWAITMPHGEARAWSRSTPDYCVECWEKRSGKVSGLRSYAFRFVAGDFEADY